jgi:hypothetical protein
MPTTASLPSEQALNDSRSRTILELSKLPVFRGAALKLLNIFLDATCHRGIRRSLQVGPSSFCRTPPCCQLRHIRRAMADRVYQARSHIPWSGTSARPGKYGGFLLYVRNVPRSECVNRLWSHSIATAVTAEAVGKLYGLPDAYTAGLMHDIGRLSLLRVLGTPYEETMSVEAPNVEEANEVEKGRFGITHCEAVERVARGWGLPRSLMMCMAQHHGQ